MAIPCTENTNKRAIFIDSDEPSRELPVHQDAQHIAGSFQGLSLVVKGTEFTEKRP
jgi:hypothetical protein